MAEGLESAKEYQFLWHFCFLHLPHPTAFTSQFPMLTQNTENVVLENTPFILKFAL